MTDPEPERKTRAIVFSDIKGYSRMMGENESLALRLLDEHNSICVPLIKRSGGAVLKFIGDAVLSSFESASDAVLYGISLQRALAERNSKRPENERIVVRIGVHIGDVVLKDGDIFGDGVNIAARIEPIAEPGGIAISQTVYDMIRARPEIQTVALGAKNLKNIKESVNIYKVIIEAQEGRSTAGKTSETTHPRRRLRAGIGLLVGIILIAAALIYKFPRSGNRHNLLTNPRFSQGLSGWIVPPESASSFSTNSRAGLGYAETFLPAGKRSATLWAADASGKIRYFAVHAGDIVTFGARAYRVSGEERIGCKLAAIDEKMSSTSWISPVPPDAEATASWIRQEGSYKVLPGKNFVGFFLEILANNDAAADSLTVARFNDAFLQIQPASREPAR